MYQDRKVQIAILIDDKAPITILTEYLDFFSKKSVTILPEHTKINTHVINLEKDKQPLYRPIYSLGLVEIETLKTYIKTNLANDSIHAFKFSASAPILFDKKLNTSF